MAVTPLPDGLVQSLEDVASRLRIDSIRATTAAGSGHPTSAASAAGLAAGARMLGTDACVLVLLGDGETAEGSVWEAAEIAGHEKLANLVALVDVNGLGQSGPTMLGHDLKAYQRRFAAFGWRAVTLDGHDLRQIVPALRRARASRQAPTAIIAGTEKGHGIEGVAGLEGWHGKALPADMAERAIAALESRLHHVPAPPVRPPARKRLPKREAPPAPAPKAYGEVA